MAIRHSLLFLLALSFTLPARATLERSFVETKNGKNIALMVAVGHGLTGLDLDMKNVERIVTHPAYRFSVSRLEEAKGTVANVADELERSARAAGSDGTLLFYYTGHGDDGLIWLQDDTMKVEAIRAAIEKGRVGLGPLKRLVLIYDSCHAGSMMDPMRRLRSDRRASRSFADAVVAGLSSPSRDGRAYWDKLLVIASSMADENSLASPEGSIYTLAFAKAFDEAIQTNETMGVFFRKSQEYTIGHHPVARFVPQSLENEKLIQ